MFDSKESYFANADSPEQNERYEEMMKFLPENRMATMGRLSLPTWIDR